MAYLDPLAYLLGVEGAALLRGFIGEYDREFTEARIAEIRRLLDTPELQNRGVEIRRADTVTGYGVWADSYDTEDNGLFPLDTPIVRSMLDPVKPGDALDAACGTGRFAEYLAGHGHHVTGVDSSADMLAHARRRVPQATFAEGDLHSLPVADDSMDVVVCALSLTHLPDLGPPVSEFARVLRPGGHLVLVDLHHSVIEFGSVPKMVGPNGEPLMMPAYRHYASDYLQAALPLGFLVRRCEEPRLGPAEFDLAAADGATVGHWNDWPWSLSEYAPAAVSAAQAGVPILTVWHFQLPG